MQLTLSKDSLPCEGLRRQVILALAKRAPFMEAAVLQEPLVKTAVPDEFSDWAIHNTKNFISEAFFRRSGNRTSTIAKLMLNKLLK